MPTEQILSEEQLIILVRAAMVMAQRVCHARFCDSHPMGQAEVCKVTTEGVEQFDALCQTMRALRVSDRHHYDLWLALKERHRHKFATADGQWADTCRQCGITTGDDHDGYDCIAWLSRRLSEVEKERDALRTRLRLKTRELMSIKGRCHT